MRLPIKSDKLHFNTYVNQNQRNEYNLNLSQKFNESFSAGLLSHVSFNPALEDRNKDGFADIPTGKQYNFTNKYAVSTKKGFEAQFGGSYLKVPLGDRNGQTDDVGLLERTATDHRLAHLTGDGDERAGIHEGISDGRDEVRRARAAGGHANASLAGRTRITFRSEAAALFVTRQDGADLGLGKRLVDFHACAAGIGKNDFDAFAFEGFNENVAAEHQRTDFAGRGGCGLGGRFLGFGGCCFAHVSF